MVLFTLSIFCNFSDLIRRLTFFINPLHGERLSIHRTYRCLSSPQSAPRMLYPNLYWTPAHPYNVQAKAFTLSCWSDIVNEWVLFFIYIYNISSLYFTDKMCVRRVICNIQIYFLFLYADCHVTQYTIPGKQLVQTVFIWIEGGIPPPPFWEGNKIFLSLDIYCGLHFVTCYQYLAGDKCLCPLHVQNCYHCLQHE